MIFRTTLILLIGPSTLTTASRYLLDCNQGNVRIRIAAHQLTWRRLGLASKGSSERNSTAGTMAAADSV
eukprot:349996-Pleurochrysis_carterae.AAC.1